MGLSFSPSLIVGSCVNNAIAKMSLDDFSITTDTCTVFDSPVNRYYAGTEYKCMAWVAPVLGNKIMLLLGEEGEYEYGYDEGIAP